MKIHCIEAQKKDFDKFSIDKIREMVGWIESPDKENKYWDVTLMGGGGFECKDQATAIIIASLEEIKAMIMSK